MDLKTRYLGLELEHPILAGASPLSSELSGVQALEEAGAAAVVLESLYEELVSPGDFAAVRRTGLDRGALESPGRESGQGMRPAEYLRFVNEAKANTSIPIIASLNGTTRAGWMGLATDIQEAGADALELNIYEMASLPDESASEVEKQTCDLIRSVADALTIPVAVKITPFYTSLPDLTRSLHAAGADALVLFNRHFQADFDPESGELIHTVRLSDPSELLLRISWVASLYGRVELPLAITGGVHGPADLVKALLAGAQVVQVVSTLMRYGLSQISVLRRGLADWLEAHDCSSLDDMRGSMSLQGCSDPKAYERRRYVQVLQSW